MRVSKPNDLVRLVLRRADRGHRQPGRRQSPAFTAANFVGELDPDARAIRTETPTIIKLLIQEEV